MMSVLHFNPDHAIAYLDEDREPTRALGMLRQAPSSSWNCHWCHGQSDLTIGDETFVQRRAAMGTDVIESEEALRIAEKRDLRFADHDEVVRSDGDVVQFECGLGKSHVKVSCFNFRFVSRRGKGNVKAWRTPSPGIW